MLGIVNEYIDFYDISTAAQTGKTVAIKLLGAIKSMVQTPASR